MPTTTQPTNNSALPQALNELQKSTATFDSTKQAVTVIVKHLSGNLLNLSLATGLLNKPALLANPVIQGELSNGQAHQIRITDGSPPDIAFFSANKPAEKTLINLNNQQVDTLVKLSAKQLMAYLAQFKSVTFNATVLANSTSLIPTDTLSLSQQSAQPAAPSLAQGVNQLLKLKLTGMPATAEIEIQLKQPHKFSGGEKLALTVVPKGVNWQVNLATTGQQDIKQPQATSTNRQAPLPYSQSVLVAPDQSLNLTKSVIQQLSHSQSADIPLSTKLVLQQLKLIANSSTAATSAVQQLTQALQTQPIDKLSLVLNEQSHFQLKIETNQPTATIPITKEIAHALAPLKLPEQQRLIKLINQAAASELSPSPSDTQTVKQTPVDIHSQRRCSETYD
ncbi:hypothetical protein RS130_21605 [Paraglaciecola aquimarina]|uniref:Flagellar hook-length control protein-like C-terminal domain-containing protein n=1 Tax=Paraglaciecola aquimarina TaxID=1235557 RepID=A0ABU3T1I4_9ALTE|nr:hypothetical protein [Paraglaciecola aquimarina]MDU0356137.1 hypothetical protein [Paraglaciecola aquimarina]